MKMTNYFFKNHKTISKSKSGRILSVSKDILFETHKSFQEYFKKQKEAVVYWYGVESIKENQDYVVCVVVPNAVRNETNYSVSMEEAAEMGKNMIKNNLVCLAQFHTHPSKNTEHSDYDDGHAISSRDGFLSLIAPRYGRYLPQSLKEISVHEVWENEWFMLNNSAKSNRIHVIDSLIDLRNDED